MLSTTIYLTSITALVAWLPGVKAHGYISGIVSGGTWYSGFNPTFIYYSPPPVVAGWTTDDISLGYIAPDEYTSDNVTCHHSGTPGKAVIPVAAGSEIELEWTTWPVSHHGPVITYLAPCSGNCTTQDKDLLEFFKIDAVGAINLTDAPGIWATDELIANNNTWTLTIPAKVEPGYYVLRNEIIALQTAGNPDGAQNYPQCINIQITGSGTVAPSGVKGTALYTETDPGITYDIYNNPNKTYPMPGPAIPVALL